MLDKVLVTPMRAEVALLPLVVYIQQGEMIAARNVKILARSVRVYDFILWSVEDCPIHGQHSGDGGHFFRTTVLLASQ